MRLVFITVSTSALRTLIEVEKSMAEEFPGIMSLKLYFAAEEVSEKKQEEMMTAIEEGDLILVDLMGAPPTMVKTVYHGLEITKAQIIPFGSSAREYLRLGKFSAETMTAQANATMPDRQTIKKMQGMAETMGKVMPGKMRDMRNYMHICKYFSMATNENIRNMLLLILRDYGNLKCTQKIKEPYEAQMVALYNPKTMKQYKSPQDYWADFSEDMNKPTIALICSANTYPTDTSEAVSGISDQIRNIANVMIISLSGDFRENREKLECLLLYGAQKKVELVINLTPFRLGAGPMGGDHRAGIEMLKKVNVPYLHPFFMTRRTEADWYQKIQGCTATEVLISVMLPELDGCIDAIPVAAMSEGIYDQKNDVITSGLKIIKERVERLTGRIDRLIHLKNKANGDKKIAIICYNYPPGEANLFGGAFLDTFASIQAILKKLADEGYQTKAVTKEDLMKIFTAGKAVNSGKYDTNWEGMIRFSAKHYCETDEVTRAWGKKPGEIMVEDGDFFIPGVEYGNVFIGLQPTRGFHEAAEQAYHDKSRPPHHQYLAFYQWIREQFQADAVIHVGTHGTLEFLKGKECGMSGDCYPDRLIAELPHIYLYYIGNPSEAVIAKRRSYANIVSYQPPVFVQGDLYGDYLELSTEIDHYRQAVTISPASSEALYERIMTLAEKLGLTQDLETIENELYRMNCSLIPKGLHIFGSGYQEEEVTQYLDGLKATVGGESPEVLEMIAKAEQNAPINNEFQGLLKVLSGEYNSAGLAGDIYRNPEILPAGGNLYQFDPRLVPTVTAMERGKKACEDTLLLYQENEGRFPESTAVIMWGLDTSRTQGETLAQILAYLGVRIKGGASGWENKYEIIPIQELGRPRIDVTINICGFFRDMFPNLVDNLADLLDELYLLPEKDEENYFKAHSRRIFKNLINQGYDNEEALQLATSRIFGPKEGEYGTSLTGIIETKKWSEETQLGESFIASLKHVYNRRMHGSSIEGLYLENLKVVDIVSQIRSNHEYEITDLDHYYEFFGGLSKSVEIAKGKKAQLYITDTTGKNPLTETVDKAIARGIRTRVLNPKWIDGLLAHDYHGGQKIAERFENVMGLAATTNSVDPWIYDDLNHCYVEDEKMRQRMIENNPHAYMGILEQLMEYKDRGYWDATEEQLEKIKQIYLELEDQMEETI